MNKVSVVLGATGQDGALLCKKLLESGETVFGTYRRGGADKFWRLKELGIFDAISFIETHVEDAASIAELFQKTAPKALYVLAGQSYVADSFLSPDTVFKANLHGVLNVLNGLRYFAPECRTFFASSSEIFGATNNDLLLNERSPTMPQNPYGISKLAALHLVRNFREAHDLPICSGILFNHESFLRGRQFVTRKITFNLARLRMEGGDPMRLGTFDSSRDWSDAEDTINAIVKMNFLSKPQEAVVAAGKLTSLRSVLLTAADYCGFSPVFEGVGRSEVLADSVTGRPLAVLDDKYLRPKDTAPLAGDSSLLRSITTWSPEHTFDETVRKMCEKDIWRWGKGFIHV